MSLLDGLIRDNLLEGIVLSEVYIAIRSDFKNDASRFGAGTAEDPFDGSKTTGGNYKFDKIMRDFVGPNTTVYLGPGVYPTRGYRVDSGSDGWSAKSGVRIVGAGWAGQNTSPVSGASVLLLEDHTTSTCAVANNTTTGTQLNGFELSNLSINCNLPNVGGKNASAINVNGKHIRIQNVRVFNFGCVGGACDIVTIARPSIDQPDVADNVISDCVVEAPSPDSTGSITCIRLTATPWGTTTYYHNACVVRGNLIDCGVTTDFTDDFRAIAASGGRGTIIEQNRIMNCRVGFKTDVMLHSTLDIILRDNFFRNVLQGALLEMDDAYSWRLGRLIIQNNNLELTPETGTSPFGIRLDGLSSDSPRLFEQVVIRLNQIRHNDGGAGPSGTIGITLNSVAEGIVEENLIGIGATPGTPLKTHALIRDSSATVKTFNNQSSTGAFIGSWSGSKHDGDLVTDVEAAVMGL